MVRGYCEALAPTDDELAALFGLVAMRLCMSVCIAADQQRQRPDNEYLGVSQQAIARLLPVLAAIPFPLAEAAFREAAGVGALSKSKAGGRVPRAPGVDPANSGHRSAERTEHRPRPRASIAHSSRATARENAEPFVTMRVFDEMHRANVRLAIGRYDEPRLIYTDPAFASAGWAVRRASEHSHRARPVRGGGHAGVCAVRRHRARIRGQSCAAGLRAGDRPAPRDR